MHRGDSHNYNGEHGIGAFHGGIGACVAWRMNRLQRKGLSRSNQELNLDALDKFKSINDMQRKISGLETGWGSAHN